MARVKPRIKTQLGRTLTGSCSQTQAARLLDARLAAENKHQRKPRRDGNCTFQSAQYVLHYGNGTSFDSSNFVQKFMPDEKPATKPRFDTLGHKKSGGTDWTGWWWKKLPFDR